ncbi:hypothetical protein HY501_01995 [Candidatus Woesearchaeota archaeon]|nr:hypothetical protein [Candidatus Woesearchaeota archaeon]
MQPIDDSLKKIMDKYGLKIDRRLGQAPVGQKPANQAFTREYGIFRDEALSFTESLYERACNFSSTLIKIKPKEEEAEPIRKAIEFTHLNVTAESAYSLATVTMIFLIALGFLVGIITLLIFDEVSFFFSALLILAGIIFLKPVSRYPIHLEQKLRLQSSNQMVMCVLYIVMYMRHTSNLEHAVRFAGEHLSPPLALDLRKILWDVETQRFATMKESIEFYLQRWKDHNAEFMESFHLIIASLQEPDNKRRISLLDKALNVMLEGTFEKMLHFAQNVKSPITTFYFLGVILPVLGLIMLPLVGSFLGVKWYQLALLYNIFLPIGVYFLGYKILSQRPLGFATSDVYENSERFKTLRMFEISPGKYIEPKNIALAIAVFFLAIGFLPLIIHFLDPAFDLPIDIPSKGFGKLLDYKTTDTGEVVGPFGFGSTIFSLFITLGIAISLSTYYKLRSRKLMEMRNQTKKLEKEFQSALFQLGNRISGGYPVEMVFSDVAANLRGTQTGTFFAIIDNNIRRLGMSVEEAIFNEKIGAIQAYPSALIESSMKVLVETSRKGPDVVSTAMISISSYLDGINKVNERLKDLLAEISGSMKAQISFLSPVISGIVVGIGTMITTIIGGLTSALTSAGSSPELGGLGNISNLFPLDGLIPPYFFQIVVGLYLVQVVYILSVIANGIENGIDKLNEESQLGNNLYKSTLFYLILSLITIIAFNLLASVISQRAGAVA